MNTTIETITAHRNGVIVVALKKRPLDPYSDDENTRGKHWLGLDPGTDLDSLRVVVDQHFGSMGVSPVASDSWSRLVTLCGAAWTDEVVAAFKAQSQ